MYNIKKVTELLDIPAVTIRAWENRYQIISPIRTEGGHRLYSEADIETLKWIKQIMHDKNIKISEAVSLLKQAQPASDHAMQEFGAKSSSQDGLLENLYQSLIDLDSEKANSIIDLAFSLFHFQVVFHDILTPVLYRIGEQWEVGAVTVAQEHFASELVLQRFHQFFRILPVHPGFPRAMAFCPEGEHHHMGLMLFSLFLRSKGLDVIYLGPNTPYSGLMGLIEMKKVSVIAVSVTSPGTVSELQSWIDECRRLYPSIKFVLGGSGMKACPASLLPLVLAEDYKVWEDWFQSRFKSFLTHIPHDF